MERPQNQVKMVRHQTVTGRSHGHLLIFLTHQVHEGKIIFRLVKDVIASVTPIENVIKKSTLRCACGSWHPHTITDTNLSLK